MPTPNFDLYLVTDRLHTGGRDLLWVLEHALEGGVKAIQLREKDLSGKELFILAEKTRRLCQRYEAALLINDRLDVALAVDAAGVQLGKSSLPLPDARALLGNNRYIGASVHSLEEAQYAEIDGADFIVFGPVYFTPSKAAYGAPQGVPALKKIVEIARLPVYAIGGIKPDNITELRSACVKRVALISAIVEAPQPKQATEEIIRLLRR
ncbi:MAG TPA: thiamine phosphate synthase [Candidatus Eisenbacteria bacterium]|nr:thiamine phosphate synthase [Candidatus Eisenbacteria bacterium]